MWKPRIKNDSSSVFIRLIYWTRYRHSKTPNTGCGNPHFQFFLKSSILFNNGLNTVSLDDVINNGFLLLEWRFLALRFFPPHLGWGGYAYYVTLFVLLKQSKSFFLSKITVTAISLLVRRYLGSFNYVMAHKKERTKGRKRIIYITRNETMVHQVFFITPPYWISLGLSGKQIYEPSSQISGETRINNLQFLDWQKQHAFVL